MKGQQHQRCWRILQRDGWSHTLNTTRVCGHQGSLGIVPTHIPQYKHLLPAVSPGLAVSVTLPRMCRALSGEPQLALEVSTSQARSGLSGENTTRQLSAAVAFCLLFKSPDCLSLLLLALTSWAALGCFLHLQAKGGWKGGRQGWTRWPPFSTCNTCWMPQCWEAELWDHWVKLGPQAAAFRF